MSVTTLVIALIIGVAAGYLSGLVGVGGGIIIVPALIYFMAFAPQKAAGTSLAVLLAPAGIFAVLNYYKQGYVDFKVAIVICASFLLGGYLGSKTALVLPVDTIKKIFALLLIAVGIKMLWGK